MWRTIALGVATTVALVGPILLWDAFGDAMSWLPWLCGFLLAGALWLSSAQHGWVDYARRVAARYLVSVVELTLLIFVLPVALALALGELVAVLAIVPIALFGAAGLSRLLVEHGVVASAPFLEGPVYWSLVAGLAALSIGILVLLRRLSRRTEGGLLAGMAEARDGISALLAAFFGVRLG